MKTQQFVFFQWIFLEKKILPLRSLEFASDANEKNSRRPCFAKTRLAQIFRAQESFSEKSPHKRLQVGRMSTTKQVVFFDFLACG